MDSYGCTDIERTSGKDEPIFGYKSYVLPNEKQQKLAPWSKKCMFHKYETNKNFGYQLWNPKQQLVLWGSDVVLNKD